MLALLPLSLFPFALPHLAQAVERAGAPLPSPIPSNCTFNNHTLPDTNFRVSPAFQDSFGLYAYYLQPYQAAQPSDALIDRCLQTCYGYGNVGDCVSIYFAYHVPYTLYNVTAVGTGCLMYSRHIRDRDLVAVDGDTDYVDAKAVNIDC
jgi:hypothetical protein